METNYQISVYSRTVNSTLRDLIQLGMVLTRDEDITADIISKVLKSFRVKKFRERAGVEANSEYHYRDYQFSNLETVFLFKKMIYFYKRDYVTMKRNLTDNKFEKLSWVERSFANLIYVFHFHKQQVMDILDITQSDYLIFCHKMESTLGEDKSFPQDDQALFKLGNQSVRQSALYKFHKRVGKNRFEQSKDMRKSIPNYPFPSKELELLKKGIFASLKL